ncbi:DNA polymerase III subunit beta [Vicingus serpentipes]|uniref:Beta sliding clamp n=1 Tax=Vicingus serpentipes TaxID=1926625 RepID=A0A5C6RT93_9FLAO|nr:DNA polymerase III subunit beta [Vicingus serpentipes]TXB65483.1 DNA polymerase III subunit beta [Vicingus serpentipes]
MKFIVSSSILLKQLQLVGGVLNSSNTLPILDNFLFEIKKGKLSITASDLETTMITQVNVEAKEDGVIAMPAKLLLDTLKTFPEQPLTFTIDNDNFGVEISSDYGKYKLTGHNGSEFPKTPKLDSPSNINIDAATLANGINKSLFATGNDELRPVMSGVFFELNNDDLTFVATDAHKLVKYKRTDIKSEVGSSFILPKKPLTLLKGVLANLTEEVKVQYNETNAMFAFGDTKMICRLIDGKYPNYNAVIPTENPNKLTINRNALLSSVKRVSIFSNKTTHQVRLKITGSELSVSAEDLDFANEANERLTCQYEGEDMEIGFNSRFLVEMLTNLTSEEVNIAMSAPNRAGILTPSEKEDEAEEILMLVMPVMLNN